MGTIEKAIEILGEIKYKPNSVGYFVIMNDVDLGESDYCRKCIPSVVKDAKRNYFNVRNEILEKFNQIEQTGFYKGVDVKSNYTIEEIKTAKKLELEKYPIETKFDFRGHDPSFSGGNTEPESCELCGHYFDVPFAADEECAKYLLENFNTKKKFYPRLKWTILIALENYEYCSEAAKSYLFQIAEKITNH